MFYSIVQVMIQKIVIAVDGFSSCGKSTMAKMLAREIGYRYIDTGAMYRAITLYAWQHGFFREGRTEVSQLEKALDGINISFVVNPETGDSETYLNGQHVENEIRGMEVANHVSSIAKLPFVRQALVALQRRMGKEKGIVMDGRDIGTVVFPEAELKIFVTASPEVRAYRRWKELNEKGDTVTFEEILENVKSRDLQDTTRSVSPLRKADDAYELDNTSMTVDEQNKWLLNKYHKLIEN